MIMISRDSADQARFALHGAIAEVLDKHSDADLLQPFIRRHVTRRLKPMLNALMKIEDVTRAIDSSFGYARNATTQRACEFFAKANV